MKSTRKTRFFFPDFNMRENPKCLLKCSKAFSLIELMISLIVISCITAAFAPVVTKKLKSSNVSVSMSQGSTSEITTECAESFSDSCKLCTSTYCIQCELSSCASGTYTDSRTCSCKNCSDIFSNCIECDSEKCTKCKDNNYYINNNKCESCPTNKICDGINAYDKAYCDNPPAGYYCEGNTIKKCTQTYTMYCTSCDATACKSCVSEYFLSNGTCKPCSDGCVTCTSATNCTKCNDGRILDSNNACNIFCPALIQNCVNCTSSTVCTTCKGGYYINSSNLCSACSDSIPNCKSCNNSSTCLDCIAGYYLDSSAKCSKCTIANCAVCNRDGSCASCIQGYYVSKDKNQCIASEEFNCSDSNFMQIGNLCVTRKNMGDSLMLPIPQTVNIAETQSEYCYSNSSKCCWKGATSATCDAENGGYSGCTRTVCNWEAANEICSKFTYGGKTWRLPTKDEMVNFSAGSLGLEQNGLMLCDYSSGMSAKCPSAAYCKGAFGNWCSSWRIWAQKYNQSPWHGALGNGIFSRYALNETYSASVRCVTEIE